MTACVSQDRRGPRRVTTKRFIVIHPLGLVLGLSPVPIHRFLPMMRLRHRRFDLQLNHQWVISSDLSSGGKRLYPVVFVELQDSQGRSGIGEGSPSNQYQESHETVRQFLDKIDPHQLSFENIPASMAYLDTIAPGRYPAKCAVNLALLDGAAKAAGQSVSEFLGLPFQHPCQVSSFTIGLDTPDMIERKTREADGYPILKMKVGSPADRENLSALRRAAPDKRIRVDANAAWQTKEEALCQIEWMAADGRIEFVEQPMPPSSSEDDLVWLKEHSPLPLIADESYQSAADAAHCARCYHGVNVKLVKTGGISAAKAALEAARAIGLKTMIGCMIESSVLISAGAHLASLSDYLDLDGNVLICNDPYTGVRNEGGRLSWVGTASQTGLRVSPRT
jgi:L-alanine-DL-glutamate epimerase-like enolase superfamily enzyme